MTGHDRGAAFYHWLQARLLPDQLLVRRFIATHLPAQALPQRLCLDVGGGIAPFGDALAAALPSSVRAVIDIEPAVRPDFAAAAERLPLADGSAGLVTFFQVLQHLPRPDAALAEASRVLGSGGLLLVTYPFFYPEGRSRDLRRWSDSGIVAELAAAGFEPIVRERWGGLCFVLLQLLAALPPRLLIAHRRGWRTGPGATDRLRVAMAFAFALPWHLLSFPALVLGRLAAVPGFYLGGIVLVRKRDRG